MKRRWNADRSSLYAAIEAIIDDYIRETERDKNDKIIELDRRLRELENKQKESKTDSAK